VAAAVGSLDERLLRLARTRGHGTARVERVVAGFSRAGEHGALWLAIGAGGVLLDAERRSCWARATATVAGAYALNTLLKLLLRRGRPALPGLEPLTSTVTELSFPSAHAATSFADARSYVRLGLPPGPLYGLAVALSLSRLYLGVHYPSDVLAGAALGVVAGGLGCRGVVAGGVGRRGMLAGGLGCRGALEGR
jgi:undecaprenyl-diphosphatase